MKRPTKPPLPPAVPQNPEPSSGRARKDVAYTPSQGIPAVAPASVRSLGALRAPPQLPSQVGANSDDPYDLLEDLATPTRQPPEAQALATGPMPSIAIPTGPIQPLQAPPPPPPSMPMPLAPQSSRGSGLQAAAVFAPPPSSRGPVSVAPVYNSGPMSVGPMSVGPISPPRSGPMSVPGQQITGPQTPVQQRPEFSTGSYPTGTAGPPSSSRSPTPVDDGVPLGYVVASAFFLAIALVGFGLYLAFEVISL